jgi:site-specific DNA-methyltransferase (cytosine-N4-specific)
VRDRLSTTYEFVFLLTANLTYHVDLDAIRIPLLRPEALDEGITVGGPHVAEGALLGASSRRRGRSVYGATYGDPASFPRGPHGAAIRPTGRRLDRTHPRGKNPGDVWHLSTRPQRRHGRAVSRTSRPSPSTSGCAASPPAAPRTVFVLDPFSGTATTGLAALQLGRRYIGIELNPSYNRLAAARLADHPRPSTSGPRTSDRSEPPR